MTQIEREELIFDLAQHKVKKLSEAGIYAMAVDQMCYILGLETNERLLRIAPPHLTKEPINKPSGF